MKLEITFLVDTSILNLDDSKIRDIKKAITSLIIDVEDEIIGFPKRVKIKEIK